MSFKYESQDLHIILRRLRSGRKVWMFGLLHELKRHGIFYYWVPGQTEATRVSNLLLNDPSTLRQRYILIITKPHLNDFLNCMEIDWQHEGANSNRHFIEMALINLERMRLVPDGTQAYWIIVLQRELPTPPTSESASLPSSGDDGGDSDPGPGLSSRTPTSHKDSNEPGPSARSPRSRGGQPDHPFSSAGSDRLAHHPAMRALPLSPGTKTDQSTKRASPAMIDQGAKAASPAKINGSAKGASPAKGASSMKTDQGAKGASPMKTNQGAKRASPAKTDQGVNAEAPARKDWLGKKDPRSTDRVWR